MNATLALIALLMFAGVTEDATSDVVASAFLKAMFADDAKSADLLSQEVTFSSGNSNLGVVGKAGAFGVLSVTANNKMWSVDRFACRKISEEVATCVIFRRLKENGVKNEASCEFAIQKGLIVSIKYDSGRVVK